MWADLADEDKLGDIEKRWRPIAQATDFGPNEFDPYLVSLIQTGWCDKTALAAAFSKVNAEVDKQRATERVREAIYRAYTTAFSLTRDQYVQQVRNVLGEEIDRLYVHDFAASLAHLRMCGDDPSDLARSFITRRGDHLEDVARAEDRSPIEDPILDAEVKRREQAWHATRFTLDGVATDIVSREGRHNDEIQYLAQRSVDEYEQWLLSGPANLRRKVQQMLDFRTITGLGEPFKVVANRVAEALRRFAQKNDFDRDRIARAYGVRLDEAQPPDPAG